MLALYKYMKKRPRVDCEGDVRKHEVALRLSRLIALTYVVHFVVTTYAASFANVEFVREYLSNFIITPYCSGIFIYMLRKYY